MPLKTLRCEFLVDNLDLPEAAACDGASWEPFQIDHLNDDSTFRITDKSRQIAYSFTVAAEAVANALIHKESTIFVSINQEEAMEKIRYAKRVYDNLIPVDRSKLIRDTLLGLEFANGARILSFPSNPPRGKAKMHIVLDEFAHVQRDRDIYTAALPIIVKGGGRIRIGSSPMGATGMFWEISQQELREYPGYNRVKVPWWAVHAFCEGGILPPYQLALNLLSEERVRRFGNQRIRDIFGNLMLDDFQQEFECLYVDESVSYFSWDLIRANQDGNLKYWHVKDPDDIGRVAREMKGACAQGTIESVLVGGIDIGHKKDLTEAIFLGNCKGHPVRLMISLNKQKFDVQKKCIRHVLNILPVSAFLVDSTGLGADMAESLESDTIAEGVTFTNTSKELWATTLRLNLERNDITIPKDRELAYQIHSIKKMVTAAKNNRYDTERNEKHHADKMWALALANWAGKEFDNRPTLGPAPRWLRR